MIFSFQELFDIIAMTFIIGYIFKDIIPSYAYNQPVTVESFQQEEYRHFLFAIIAVAPAIILHELGHKFVALAFGVAATFHAAYGFLLFGLVLKLLQFPFIFFVPAYVTHGATAIGAGIIIALAGPLMHAFLWLGARCALQYNLLPKKYHLLAAFTQYVNGFLFVLNILPIPGFDGFHIVYGLFQLFNF